MRLLMFVTICGVLGTLSVAAFVWYMAGCPGRCRLFRHVPEEYTISPCSPIIKGVRCKRCGEKWPQCVWCGLRPATMKVRGSGEDVCRPCVGV